jgi:hypothetical protein
MSDIEAYEAIVYCKVRAAQKYGDRAVHILGMDESTPKPVMRIIDAPPYVDAIWAAISCDILHSTEQGLTYSFHLKRAAGRCPISVGTKKEPKGPRKKKQ